MPITPFRVTTEGRAARAATRAQLDSQQLGRIDRAGKVGALLATPVADGMAALTDHFVHLGLEGTLGLGALATGVLTGGFLLAGRAYAYGLPENQPREPMQVEARPTFRQRLRDGFERLR